MPHTQMSKDSMAQCPMMKGMKDIDENQRMPKQNRKND